MNTIADTLAGSRAAHARGAQRLAAARCGDCCSPRCSGCRALGADRARRRARRARALARLCRALIDRRVSGAPVAYLTGTREFWSLPLNVTPAVLVPRPETELLVELALELLAARTSRASVLDLGTGSGAIALAIASERPRCARHRASISRRRRSTSRRENSRDLGAAAASTGAWAPGSRRCPASASI